MRTATINYPLPLGLGVFYVGSLTGIGVVAILGVALMVAAIRGAF